ncbi:hypothetical protein, partial [Corynebacterium sp.]|uniref:hypothetical protein n=1 Tax=Corynebacterium sp. TaxID=1720 RepID=UPI0027BA2DE5
SRELATRRKKHTFCRLTPFANSEQKGRFWRHYLQNGTKTRRIDQNPPHRPKPAATPESAGDFKHEDAPLISNLLTSGAVLLLQLGSNQ